MTELAPGLLLRPAHFSRTQQEAIVDAIRDVVRAAPLFTPTMPRTGKPFSVRMTNCGPLGWLSDRDKGYRYESRHPETGAPWPAMPQLLLEAWDALTHFPKPPEACLVNVYDESAKMGLHQDRDEAAGEGAAVAQSIGRAVAAEIVGVAGPGGGVGAVERLHCLDVVEHRRDGPRRASAALCPHGRAGGGAFRAAVGAASFLAIADRRRGIDRTPRVRHRRVAVGSLTSMLLAELQIWHSRPFTPTRRVALGHLVLPADPAPGFGGLLLGAVVARYLPEVDDDLVPDIHRLLGQVETGERVIQPRLRHRYQVDRHGLTRSIHRLLGEGEEVQVEFAPSVLPLQQILGAVYAVERLDAAARHGGADAIHRAMRWRGPIGPQLMAHLAGSRSTRLSALADPRAWALEVLGFPQGTAMPSKKAVQQRFRERLREVHPDFGGAESSAARAIADLSEARRVLSS